MPELPLFLRGEIALSLTGADITGLLSAAAAHGVPLRNIRRIAADTVSLALPLPDLLLLARLCRAHRCRLHIVQQRGMPFILAFLRRRPLLPLGALFGMLILAFLCSIVVEVRVTSAELLSAEDAAQVLQLADEAGIRPLRSCWLMDLEGAEEHILDQFRELYYAEIFVHGNCLEISVVHRTNVPDSVAPKPAGDLVAAVPGIIEEVLVRRGTAACAPGDIVNAGTVLVEGWMNGEAVAADAIVTARIFAEGYGECLTESIVCEPTGNVAQSIRLRFAGGQDVTLFGTTPSWAEYHTRRVTSPLYLWRNIPLPVELIKIEVSELATHTRTYSNVEAAGIARERAATNASAALFALQAPLFSHTVTITTERIETEDQVVRYHATASALAHVAIFQALSTQEQEAYEQRAQAEETQTPVP